MSLYRLMPLLVSSSVFISHAPFSCNVTARRSDLERDGVSQQADSANEAKRQREEEKDVKAAYRAMWKKPKVQKTPAEKAESKEEAFPELGVDFQHGSAGCKKRKSKGKVKKNANSKVKKGQALPKRKKVAVASTKKKQTKAGKSKASSKSSKTSTKSKAADETDFFKEEEIAEDSADDCDKDEFLAALLRQEQEAGIIEIRESISETKSEALESSGKRQKTIVEKEKHAHVSEFEKVCKGLIFNYLETETDMGMCYYLEEKSDNIKLEKSTRKDAEDAAEFFGDPAEGARELARKERASVFFGEDDQDDEYESEAGASKGKGKAKSRKDTPYLAEQSKDIISSIPHNPFTIQRTSPESLQAVTRCEMLFDMLFALKFTNKFFYNRFLEVFGLLKYRSATFDMAFDLIDHEAEYVEREERELFLKAQIQSKQFVEYQRLRNTTAQQPYKSSGEGSESGAKSLKPEEVKKVIDDSGEMTARLKAIQASLDQRHADGLSAHYLTSITTRVSEASPLDSKVFGPAATSKIDGQECKYAPTYGKGGKRIIMYGGKKKKCASKKCLICHERTADKIRRRRRERKREAKRISDDLLPSSVEESDDAEALNDDFVNTALSHPDPGNPKYVLEITDTDGDSTSTGYMQVATTTEPRPSALDQFIFQFLRNMQGGGPGDHFNPFIIQSCDLGKRFLQEIGFPELGFGRSSIIPAVAEFSSLEENNDCMIDFSQHRENVFSAAKVLKTIFVENANIHKISSDKSSDAEEDATLKFTVLPKRFSLTGVLNKSDSEVKSLKLSEDAGLEYVDAAFDERTFERKVFKPSKKPNDYFMRRTFQPYTLSIDRIPKEIIAEDASANGDTRGRRKAKWVGQLCPIDGSIRGADNGIVDAFHRHEVAPLPIGKKLYFAYPTMMLTNAKDSVSAKLRAALLEKLSQQNSDWKDKAELLTEIFGPEQIKVISPNKIHLYFTSAAPHLTADENSLVRLGKEEIIDDGHGENLQSFTDNHGPNVMFNSSVKVQYPRYYWAASRLVGLGFGINNGLGTEANNQVTVARLVCPEKEALYKKTSEIDQALEKKTLDWLEREEKRLARKIQRIPEKVGVKLNLLDCIRYKNKSSLSEVRKICLQHGVDPVRFRMPVKELKERNAKLCGDEDWYKGSNLSSVIPGGIVDSDSDDEVNIMANFALRPKQEYYKHLYSCEGDLRHMARHLCKKETDVGVYQHDVSFRQGFDDEEGGEVLNQFEHNNLRKQNRDPEKTVLRHWDHGAGSLMEHRNHTDTSLLNVEGPMRSKFILKDSVAAKLYDQMSGVDVGRIQEINGFKDAAKFVVTPEKKRLLDHLEKTASETHSWSPNTGSGDRYAPGKGLGHLAMRELTAKKVGNQMEETHAPLNRKQQILSHKGFLVRVPAARVRRRRFRTRADMDLIAAGREDEIEYEFVPQALRQRYIFVGPCIGNSNSVAITRRLQDNELSFGDDEVEKKETDAVTEALGLLQRGIRKMGV